MNKVKKIIIISLIIVFVSQSLFCALDDTGTGAKPASMGNAFVADSGSMYSALYNPASLWNITQTQLLAGYSMLYYMPGSSNYIAGNNAAFCIPVKKGVFGIGLSYDNLAIPNALSGNKVNLIFGLKLKSWIGFGIGFKYFNDSYLLVDNDVPGSLPSANGSSSFYNVDSGVILMLSKYFSAGLNARNILQEAYQLNQGAGLQILKDRFVKPDRLYTAGFSYQSPGIMVNLDFFSKLTAYGTSGSAQEGLSRWRVGMEKYLFGNGNPENKFNLAFRAGFELSANDDNKNMSAGIGMGIYPLEIDYAWTAPMNSVDNASGSHCLFLSMRFGKITANTGIENRKAAKIKSALPGLAEAFNAEVGSQPQVEMSMSTPAVSLSTAVPLSTSVKLSTSAPVIIDEKFVNTESALAVLKDMDEPGVVHSGRIPVDETPVIKKSNTRAKKKISLPSKVRIAKTAKTPKKTEKVIKSDNIVRTHIVKPGDTLVSLAQQYYGDRSRWVSIYRTNENKIEKGVLKPGEKLILP